MRKIETADLQSQKSKHNRMAEEVLTSNQKYYRKHKRRLNDRRLMLYYKKLGIAEEYVPEYKKYKTTLRRIKDIDDEVLEYFHTHGDDALRNGIPEEYIEIFKENCVVLFELHNIRLETIRYFKNKE